MKENGVDLFTRYKRALESLTPGGSEFEGNPEACAKFVRDVRGSQQRLLQDLTTQRNNLEDKCNTLAKMLEALKSS